MHLKQQIMKNFEEFIQHYDIEDYNNMSLEQAKQIAIDFARYHTEEALLDASENAKVISVLNEDMSLGYRKRDILCVDKQSILESYDLNNIK